MVQTEEMEAPAPKHRPFHFEWLLPMLYRPGKTMRAIVAEERGVWAVPMLLLTVLTIVLVLVAAPVRRDAALSNQGELPESYQYLTPEEQEQYNQVQQSKVNVTTTTIFPGIGALAGLWLGWFILGGILHLALTLLGSRSTTTTAYNLAAWASVPFVVRLLVQIGALLFTHKLISSPGVSGFIASDSTGVLMFARILLSMVDLYLIWQFTLLVVGSASTPGLTRGKALWGVLASIVLLLALSAIPGFIASQLSGLDVSGGYFFF